MFSRVDVVKGKTKLFIFSARWAFPCFDEPGFKTTFTFTMKYRYEEYSCIFNTGIASTTKDGDLTTNVYHTTMKLPTYLLAILLSDYHLESKGTSPGGVEGKDQFERKFLYFRRIFSKVRTI